MRSVIFLLFGLFITPGWLQGGVRRVHVPQDGISPDVVVGSSGKVYLVFARGQNAFLAISNDNGNTFFTPTQLNREPRSVLGGHERGPKIALGAGETVLVVWMSARSDQLLYTRGQPDAGGLSAPRNLLDAATHLDGAAVAADEQGNVLVAWLDARQPEDHANPLSVPIFWTESQDDGQTFSKNGTSPAFRACSCCALRAMVAPQGGFDVAFRGAYNNIRDIFLARFAASEAPLAPAVGKIHNDNWEFKACPMSGPSLALAPSAAGGDLWAAWMSRGKVYYAEGRDDGQTFAEPRTPHAARLGPENHPLILVNGKGEVFFAWEEGSSIRWQITDTRDKVIDSGTAGTLPENSKAAAFLDREGNFCLVF